VDDPEVDAGHSGRIGAQSFFVGGNWHFGGHVDEQLGTYVEESDRTHRGGIVRDEPR
jgi:hypothetical protein